MNAQQEVLVLSVNFLAAARRLHRIEYFFCSRWRRGIKSRWDGVQFRFSLLCGEGGRRDDGRGAEQVTGKPGALGDLPMNPFVRPQPLGSDFPFLKAALPGANLAR